MQIGTLEIMIALKISSLAATGGVRLDLEFHKKTQPPSTLNTVSTWIISQLLAKHHSQGNVICTYLTSYNFLKGPGKSALSPAFASPLSSDLGTTTLPFPYCTRITLFFLPSLEQVQHVSSSDC